MKNRGRIFTYKNESRFVILPTVYIEKNNGQFCYADQELFDESGKPKPFAAIIDILQPIAPKRMRFDKYIVLRFAHQVCCIGFGRRKNDEKS